MKPIYLVLKLAESLQELITVEDKDGIQTTVALNPHPERPGTYRAGPLQPLQTTKQDRVRSCFNCQNFKICFLRKEVEKAIDYGSGMFNFDSPDSMPGHYHNIYVAVAHACLEYKEGEE